jgi:hypothetical protein
MVFGATQSEIGIAAVIILSNVMVLLKWWARQDLNLQGFPHVVLSHARLPFRHSPHNFVNPTRSLSESLELNGSKSGFCLGSTSENTNSIL